jgi:hypothetical protein
MWEGSAVNNFKLRERYIYAVDMHSFGKYGSSDTGGDGAGEPVGDQFAGGRFFHAQYEREWDGL